MACVDALHVRQQDEQVRPHRCGQLCRELIVVRYTQHLCMYEDTMAHSVSGQGNIDILAMAVVNGNGNTSRNSSHFLSGCLCGLLRPSQSQYWTMVHCLQACWEVLAFLTFSRSLWRVGSGATTSFPLSTGTTFIPSREFMVLRRELWLERCLRSFPVSST